MPVEDEHRSLDAKLVGLFRNNHCGVRYLAMLEDFLQNETAAVSRWQRVQAASAACGAFHSCVIDCDGHAWTWGARGHARSLRAQTPSHSRCLV